MFLPCYLAVTAGELAAGAPFPAFPAWMACHFSPSGAGISNLPAALPEGAMLILDDSQIFGGHDPRQVAKELAAAADALGCGSLLLDFQRPDIPGQAETVRAVLAETPCPVGVAAPYAAGYGGPVLVPPIPPDVPPARWLAPWAGREIWQELALEGLCYTVTEDGAAARPCSGEEEPAACLTDAALRCHYTLRLAPRQALFTLYRTEDDLLALLEDAAGLGVTRGVGLWQELGQLPLISGTGARRSDEPPDA